MIDYQSVITLGVTSGNYVIQDNGQGIITYKQQVSATREGDNYTESKLLIGACDFAKLGIELDFGGSKPVNTKFDYCMLISTGADLCYRGKKLIGSAQCRKEGYILQHGSILYNYNRQLLEKIFHENVSTDAITSIKEINPKLSRQQVIDALSDTVL